VSELRVRARINDALGEPDAAGAVPRLEAALHAAPDVAGRRTGPAPGAGMALVAAALAVLMLGGLLTIRAVQHRQTAGSPAPAGGGSPVTHPSPPPSAPAGGCLANAPAQLIVVHLASQQLVAYQDGCPFLSTPVTTGRPELATPAGTYSVLAKRPTMVLHSPWPPSSPHWFPDVTVRDYLAIDATGVALHSAEWEAATAFGPGSEKGPNATHGDVNVPTAPLRRLYDWAPVGTRVVVDDR
jgi:hypothetical protein